MRLHDMEAKIALAALDLADPAVIGPASSVCESAVVRDALVGHHVVWLTAPAEHLAEKAVRKSHRPMVHDGDPVELFRHQLATREPLDLGPRSTGDRRGDDRRRTGRRGRRQLRRALIPPGSADDVLGHAVPEVGGQAEGLDVDALVVAVEALAEGLHRHLG